jgi:hypothetical protein
MQPKIYNLQITHNHPYSPSSTNSLLAAQNTGKNLEKSNG